MNKNLEKFFFFFERPNINSSPKNSISGYPNDIHDLLFYLKNLPADKCKAPVIGKSAFNRSSKGLDFCPVIDGDFLPEPIAELRKKAPKIQVVIGK
jgi:hypothetical protein